MRADVLNALLDRVLTPLQIEVMLIGSMFGWDVPRANPELRRSGADGRAFTGRCTIVEHQHFLICADPQNLLGRVEDPIGDLDLAGVEVLQSRSEALAEGRHRLIGDRIPGREPVIRRTSEAPSWSRCRSRAGRSSPP